MSSTGAPEGIISHTTRGAASFDTNCSSESATVMPRAEASGTGEELREYIHVEDAARLSVQILEPQFANEQVVLTGHHPMRYADVLELIREIVGDDVRIELRPPTSGTSAHYSITPYTFRPKRARKLVSSWYVDMGQGLVDCLEEIARYAVRLVDASRPGRPGAPEFIDKWVKWGAGLRASQALVRGGKARALMHGRYNVSIKDIQALAKPVLRHRLILNFQAQSERVTADQLIAKLVAAVPTTGKR